VLSLPPAVRIFVATTPTNMHLSFDRLAALARDVLQQDPLSGHLFAFFNRGADRVKILYWDRSGSACFICPARAPRASSSMPRT
jgi:transposase